LEVAK